MDSLINDYSDDSIDSIDSNDDNEITMIEYSLTKNGIKKLNNKLNVFNIPISDLKDSPGNIVKFETIGDLVFFLNKYQYIKDCFIKDCFMEMANNKNHRADCVYYERAEENHNHNRDHNSRDCDLLDESNYTSFF
jgi:hypothetical protein